MPDFDPSELLETSFDAGDFNNTFTPFPETECYARIKKIDARKITRDDGSTALVTEFMFVTDDEAVRKETGMKEPQVRYSLWLDLKPGTMQIADRSDSPNSNVKLSRLRRACGLPDGRKFRIADLEGLSCWIKTKQSVNPRDDEDTFCNVVAVSAESFRRTRE